MTALATLLLIMMIVLCGSIIVRYLKVACTAPSRVAEIRRLRQEGLAVNQEGE